MRTRLPNWNNDPFYHLTKQEKRALKEMARSFSESLVQKNPNGTFALGVPNKLRGRFWEPESMTKRKRKLPDYMIPMKKMEEPVPYRGRGRLLKLHRERQD